MYVVLEGDLTEGQSLRDLHIDTPRVVLNLARVRYVNSEGSRRLLQWLNGLYETEIVAELCSPAIVDLLNLVPIMAGKMRVESVIVPIECPECEHEGDVRVHLPSQGAPAIEPPPCEKCGAQMEPAVLLDRYFAFRRT
jgi:hypothetical protein